jgi:glycosyltransferase involved in cell wall biosynthesis
VISFKNAPFVSVLVACWNEEKYISRCLDSIVASDYPKDRMEILVIDGMSGDATREIVKDYADRHPLIRLVDNPQRYFPAAMNVGIRNARGDVIVITSAHSLCDPKYVSTCVRYQQESGAENVGGALHIEPGVDTTVAQAIALTLSSPFGSGNAHVKTGVDQPTWADTAAFGCYRRKLFEEIGLFDERLLGSSDIDFNRRILAAGGNILLVPEIVVLYFADPTLGAFWRHNFADGVWATYVLKFRTRAWAWRHWVPMFFLLSLLGSAGLALYSPIFGELCLAILSAYVLANFSASIHISARLKNTKLLFLLPLTFGIRHFAHGIGALYGAILLAFPGEHWKGRRGRIK